MVKPKDIEKVSKKPTKGRVKTLYALPYLGCMVYLMQIDTELFMSMTIIEGTIRFFYMEIPIKGKAKNFNREQIDKILQVLIAGAHTTVDIVKGIKQDEKEKGQSAEVIRVAEEAFGGKK